MRTFIVSDYEATTVKIREILLREGWDCPAANVLSPELAVQRLAKARADMVLAVLEPDRERASPVLRELRSNISALAGRRTCRVEAHFASAPRWG